MKFELCKISEPGWTKLFDSEKDARIVLYNEMCSICRQGYPEDENGFSINPVNKNSSMGELLATQCGCEYWFGPFEN